ncbi:MAG: IS1182 family transposase [Chloroflexota bacterium]
MMGQRQFAPKLYYQLSLDNLVPQDHLLRRIAALDFSFVRRLCRPFYSHTGQPSVDPVVLFKTLLIGYLYGITSERRLMNEIQVNVAYRWFLGYDLDEDTPDHSVLSKARARFGMEVFERFFQSSIDMCREAGLLAEGPVYVDSTLVQAAASIDSMVRKGELAQPPLSVSEYVHRLYKENDAEPENEVPPAATATDPASSRRSSSRRAGRPNKELESRTDPEATVVNRPEFGRHLAYKAHLAVAGRHGQVITAAVATTGAAAEEHLLGEVLWQHRRLSRLAVPEVVADAKYGTTANFLYLGQLGIPAIIPTTRFDNMRKDIWSREHFLWLPDEEAYRCPAAQKLRRRANARTTRRVKYQAPKGSCAVCPFREQCVPSGRERSIHRSWAQGFVEAAEERIASPLGKQRMVERKVRVEGAFAFAKELHGLRRTRFRGKRRVQIQLWLTAAAMNIKKAVRTMATAGRRAAAASFLPWLRAGRHATDIRCSVLALTWAFGNSPAT